VYIFLNVPLPPLSLAFKRTWLDMRKTHLPSWGAGAKLAALSIWLPPTPTQGMYMSGTTLAVPAPSSRGHYLGVIMQDS
jgi:hypothetical protein